MTLTTDMQQFEEWLKFHSDEEECTNLLQRNSAGTNYLHPHADLAWIAWRASREALANREAQPVIIVGDNGGDALAYRRLIQSFAPGTKLYTAPPAPAAPEGFKLVPIEMSDEMANAFDPQRKISLSYLRNGWVMALAAATEAKR